MTKNRTGKSGTLRVGTSGYQYNHWKGIFYPDSVPRRRWFEHYASIFDTVEMNNTFYVLPEARTFRDWGRRAPDGFCYALKYSRYGSHLKHLADPEQHINQYLANARQIGESLGPILVQLPPKWRIDLPRLEAFLDEAPRDVRWAFEFRNDSWLVPEVYRALRKHRAASCIHDKIDGHPREITAGWTYLRYHGGNYDGNYAPEQLKTQARLIRDLRRDGVDVYAYFNNDVHGHALLNAADLLQMVAGRANRLREANWFW